MPPRSGFVPSPFVAPVIRGRVAEPSPPKPLPLRRPGDRHEDTGFRAALRADGKLEIEDRGAEFRWKSAPLDPGPLYHPPGQEWRDFNPPFDVPKVTFAFDVTDLAMRAVGQDPYRYEKQKLLDRTFELRARLAARARERRLHAALLALPGRLAAIWRGHPRTRVERIVEEWRDAEDERARKIIAAFLGLRLQRDPTGVLAGTR